MLKDAHKEVDYRLSKWIIRKLEKEQLLLPDEIEAIWRELLSIYDPPTKSIETISGTMRGDATDE